MTLEEYLDRIESDARAARALLPKAPALQTITTVDELLAALRAGGQYNLAPGTYRGNFVTSAPLKLYGAKEAVLSPSDLFKPTLTVLASDVLLEGFAVENGAPDRDCVVVGSFSETDASRQPNGVVLNGLTIRAGANGGHRGIVLHGSNLTVKKCSVTGFWERGRDAQAVWIHNGPGPYAVTDCYLEGSGENILVGGETFKISQVVPSDVIIARNTFYKPELWRTNGALVKNSVEVKCGRRVLIENNIIDGCWRNGQDGTPILLTVRNQNNDSPWAIVDQVVVHGNTVQRCQHGYAVSILGLDDNYPSQQSLSITIDHNLFKDSPNGFKIGNGVANSLRIFNNTLPAVANNLLQFYDSRALALQTPFIFKDNVAKGGDYGISGTNLGVGVPALEGFTEVVDFTGNVIEKTAARNIPWPAGNTLLAPGALAAELDPLTFKYLKGTAGI